MSEDDIRLLAKSLGLDPKRLIIREPFWHKDMNSRQYRFEFKGRLKVIDWNFLITQLEIDAGIEDELIKLHVNRGLRKILELSTQAG